MITNSPADFSHLLQNAQLTQGNINDVKKDIYRHEQSIADIDGKVAELMKTVAEMQAEKHKHKTAITRCKGVLTLARRLPPDILADIFEWCYMMDWTMAPIVLSRVSSAWLKASRIPRVWATVYVDCEAPDAIKRTQFWLRMVQNAAFDVKLRASWPPLVFDRILAALIPHAGQWRSISLETANVETVDHMLLRLPPGERFMQLRTLGIITQSASFGMPDEVSLARLSVSLSGAVNLRTLHFTCNSLRPITELPATIEDLDITIQTISFGTATLVSSLVPIIGRLVSLKRLSVRLSILDIELNETNNTEEDERTCLVKLESLLLHMPPDYHVLLDHIQTPALRNLCMRSTASEAESAESLAHPRTGSALFNLLTSTGSPPPIQSLELYDVDMPDESFAACFPHLPKLEDLRLHWSDVSDSAVNLLSAETGFCPNLRRLDLRWCLRLHGQVLVNVVKSRTSEESGQNIGTSALEEVAVLNCTFVEERDVFEIAATTVCRLTLRPLGDPCRQRRCCDNGRYRQRLRMRNAGSLSGSKLII